MRLLIKRMRLYYWKRTLGQAREQSVARVPEFREWMIR